MKVIILLMTVISFSIYAQVEDIEYIDYNFANGLITDEGVFFTHSDVNVAGYEIPKNSGKKTIYMGSIWVGAEDINGFLHVTGDNYGYSNNGNFHSGPIATQNQYSSLAYQNQYGKSIWKVNKSIIDNHIQQYNNPGYITPQEILNWPGNGNTSLGVVAQLAPYVDLNNDGIYSPLDGDYPDIRGSQAVYTIVNDESYNPGTDALGIEIHMMFYQYHDGGYLSNTTFLNTQVFNRSTTNYYDYKQSLFIDFDIGFPYDDYIGCDTARNLIFGYNGDAFDESDNGNPGYGGAPPCQGVMVLNNNLHSVMTFSNSSAFPYNDNNITDTIMWNFMHARWADSSQLLYDGAGFAGSAGVTTTPTKFMFSGNPYTLDGWSENNINGGSNPTGDRRGMMTISVDEFLIGTSICTDYAFIMDKSEGNFKNTQNVINIAGALQNLYDTQNEFPCQSEKFNSLIENELPDFSISPNPNTGNFTLILDDYTSNSALSIFDMTGRIVYYSKIEPNKVEVLLNEDPGLYFVVITSNKGVKSKKLLIH